MPTDADAGVIIFGHGKSSQGTAPRNGCVAPSHPVHGVSLAYLPLHRGRGPIEGTQVYYAGGAATPFWATDEADAITLFPTYYWTSLSAGRIGGGKWILLYQLAGPIEVPASHHLPIVARIADQPWQLATAPEIEVFDPTREGAWNRYMFGRGFPDDDRNRPHIGHPAFAYGAYLLNKYTQWDSARNVATIFFLMSTAVRIRSN